MQVYCKKQLSFIGIYKQENTCKTKSLAYKISNTCDYMYLILLVEILGTRKKYQWCKKLSIKKKYVT